MNQTHPFQSLGFGQGFKDVAVASLPQREGDTLPKHLLGLDNCPELPVLRSEGRLAVPMGLSSDSPIFYLPTESNPGRQVPVCNAGLLILILGANHRREIARSKILDSYQALLAKRRMTFTTGLSQQVPNAEHGGIYLSLASEVCEPPLVDIHQALDHSQ